MTTSDPIIFGYSPVLVGRVIGRVVGMIEPSGEVAVAAAVPSRAAFARRLIDFGIVTETTEDALSQRIGRDDKTVVDDRVRRVAESYPYALVIFPVEDDALLQPVPIAKDVVTDQLITFLDGRWHPLSPDVPERPAWLPREDT